jgi:glc operon protein GlcG
MKNLTYRDCVDCIDAVFKSAKEDKGLPICVAIVDGHGDMIAFGRMDGAPMRSIDISANKAYTCIYMDRDTHEFRAMMDKFDFELNWFGNPRLTALPGGIRIKDDSGCVGAIGLSGRLAEHDQQLAELGVEFLKARLAR